MENHETFIYLLVEDMFSMTDRLNQQYILNSSKENPIFPHSFPDGARCDVQTDLRRRM